MVRAGEDGSDHGVVLEILPNAREIDDGGDVGGAQKLLRPTDRSAA